MAFVTCPECHWRYPLVRQREHLALHPFLPDFPCTLPQTLPLGLEPNQFPLHVIGVLFHGIFTIQPVKEVLIIIAIIASCQ